MTAAMRVPAATPGGSGAPARPRGLPSPLAGLRLMAADLDTPSDRDGDWSLLSGDERARADRFHFPRDRARYAAARAFLRRALAAETGAPAESLRFVYGDRGKPLLPGGPAFNLSHSGATAVLAVHDGGEVGVDVEEAGRPADALALGRSVFTDAENGVLAALSPEDCARRFLEFWTAKEARMKLTGEGMSLAPRSIRLKLDAGGRPVGVISPAVPEVRLFALAGLGGGSIGHVAVFGSTEGAA